MNLHLLSRVGLALWALGFLNVSWSQSKTSADTDPVEALVEAINVRHLGPGTMSGQEYDSAVRDLTNFMVYLAEPAKLVRYRIGFWVMVFMLIFVGLSYLLKKEYWRDVH